jgi:hypothetical protein
MRTTLIHNKVCKNKIQIYRNKPPNKSQDDPCRPRKVIIVRIWLDFYDDDMLPWVLSSIHIQRAIPSCGMVVIAMKTGKGFWN